jgi:hypothetical protein
MNLTNNPKELISVDDLIAEVRNMLSTYDEQGLLNQQIMYGWCRKVLESLGLAALDYKEEVLHVENNVVYLPENIRQVQEIYSLEPSSEQFRSYFPDHNGYVEGYGLQPNLIVDGEYVTSINWYNKQTNKFSINTFKSPRLIPLSLSSTAPFGLNVQGDHVSRDGNKLTFLSDNHKAIYIKYFQLPTNEQGAPMYPDIESIRTAMFTYMIYQFFQKAWYNSEVPDVQNKYKDAEFQYRLAMRTALYEIKLPSFESLVRVIRNNRNRFKTFNQIINR